MTFAFFSPPMRPADEVLRQSAVDASGVLDMTDRAELTRLVEAAAALFDAPIAALSIIDGERQYFVARTGLEGRETSRTISFCGHTILTPDAAFVVADAERDPRFDGNPLVRSGPGLRFYAGVPLLGQGAMPLGSLCVIDRVSRDAPDPAAIEALAALSAEASDIIYGRAVNRSTP
jgi:GAF domain-containing protein